MKKRILSGIKSFGALSFSNDIKRPVAKKSEKLSELPSQHRKCVIFVWKN